MHTKYNRQKVKGFEKMEVQTPKGKITINTKWCKGCQICVEFCPKGVLSMTLQGKAQVSNPEKCIGCKMCELYCPDFAIAVEVTKNG